jgi:hypothetical protein
MATGIYLVDNPPVIRQFRSPRRAAPSGVIVVHTAEAFADESPPDRGAENVAAFIQRRTNYGSYHDLADSDSIIQLVRYSDEAFHDATGSNPHSYGVSAACQAAKWSSYSQAWRNATVTNMARAAVRYANWLKARSGIVIPARRITRAESEDRKPGFISHALRDPTRRTDPGASFPWTFFLSQYSQLLNGDEEMELTDTIHLKTDGTVKYSSGTTSVEGVLSSISYYTLVNRNMLAASAARETALAKAIAALSTDADITEARMREIVREAALEAVATLPAVSADAVVDELSERLEGTP